MRVIVWSSWRPSVRRRTLLLSRFLFSAWPGKGAVGLNSGNLIILLPRWWHFSLMQFQGAAACRVNLDQGAPIDFPVRGKLGLNRNFLLDGYRQIRTLIQLNLHEKLLYFIVPNIYFTFRNLRNFNQKSAVIFRLLNQSENFLFKIEAPECSYHSRADYFYVRKCHIRLHQSRA